MSNSIDLISSIEEKLIQLLALRDKDRKDMHDLSEKVQTLERLLEEKKVIINTLEQDKQSFITPSPERGKENVDLKKRVDEMLREIDKCIGMLHLWYGETKKMEEETSITVMIADRPYRLKIGSREEESVRKAVSLIDQKIREYTGNYAFKDRQDLLAMVALQFTSSLLNAEQKADNKDVIKDRLQQIDLLLEKHLHNA